MEHWIENWWKSKRYILIWAIITYKTFRFQWIAQICTKLICDNSWNLCQKKT
jgi:hypothetical protein